MDFVGLALVVALIAVAVRALRRRSAAAQVMRGLVELPGTTPETAVPIRSFHDIARFLDAHPCPCGGAFDIASEATWAGRHVVIVECDRCERTLKLHFDLSGMPN